MPSHLLAFCPLPPRPADPNNKHQEVWTPQANDQPYSGGFHTFAVDWTANTITSESDAAGGGSAVHVQGPGVGCPGQGRMQGRP